MLYLQIPNFVDPTAAPGTTITAVGKISSLQADFLNMRGTVSLAIYRDPASAVAGVRPLGNITVCDGDYVPQPDSDVLIGKPMPDMAFMQSQTYSAWIAIWEFLLTALSQQGAFRDSSVVNI